MARRRVESGAERQERIRREQHRPEQNEGYDEAARGGADVADERPDRMVPLSGEETQRQNTTEDVDDRPEDADDREARLARAQVRRQDQSASRPGSREP